MGIKHFFYWFKRRYEEHIHSISSYKQVDMIIHTLAVDMNGLFHEAARNVIEAKAGLLVIEQTEVKREEDIWLDIFKEVIRLLDNLVHKIHPTKRLVLCVDGVAPFAKQTQQKQRRFKNVSSSKFDTCSISPGTEFMHYMSKYIDFTIRKKKTSEWKHLDIVYSSEKVPGEGEHTCMHILKKYCNPTEVMVVVGLDCDLILLTLASELPNIYMYRGDMFSAFQVYLIDIYPIGKQIRSELGRDSAIADFILMSYLVGNDFLPQLPGIEILNKGLDMILSAYEKTDGLTDPYTHEIRMDQLRILLQELALKEIDAMHEKYKVRHKYHTDPFLEKYFYTSDVNMEEMRQYYYTTKVKIPFDTEHIQKVCHEYVKGLQWTMYYYFDGVPDWTWYYPYNYGPFIYDLQSNIPDIVFSFDLHEPLNIYEQLISVLPPRSSHLLPEPFRSLPITEPLSCYYPDTFEIDVTGKRAEWEGIAILPIIDLKVLRDKYTEISDQLSEYDRMRNKVETIVRYTIVNSVKDFKSKFGVLYKNSIMRSKVIV